MKKGRWAKAWGPGRDVVMNSRGALLSHIQDPEPKKPATGNATRYNQQKPSQKPEFLAALVTCPLLEQNS